MALPVPDLEGFRDAQALLREHFGQDVPFFTPVEQTWDPSVPLDPETDRPYDPTAVPVASGFASAMVHANVVTRPLGLSRRGVETDIRSTAFGDIEEGTVVLIVGWEDFDPALLEATEFQVNEERYTITQHEYDRMGPGAPSGDPDRVLFWGEQR
jgi:hypothetical protein